MSYILDALKKSEEKRGTRAAILPKSTVLSPTQPGRRRFAWPIMIALAALLLGWFVSQWQASDRDVGLNQATLNQATLNQPTMNQAAMNQAAMNQAAMNQLTKLQPGEMKAIAIRPAAAPASYPTVEQASSPLPTRSLKPPTTASVMYQQHAIQSRFELPQAVQRALPEINIAGHIYDADPQARMVIVNGSVHREKQQISAGLVLQEITTDGVIFNYHGNIFHMGVFD